MKLTPDEDTGAFPEHYPADTPGATLLNEAVDLLRLKVTLSAITLKSILLVHNVNWVAVTDHQEQKHQLDVLRDSNVELFAMMCNPGGVPINLTDILRQGEPAMHRFISEGKKTVRRVRQRNAAVEAYIMSQERVLANTTEARNHFKSTRSRFERAKWRELIDRTVAGLETKSLKKVNYRSDILHSYEPAATQHVPTDTNRALTEDICTVCQSEFEGGANEIIPRTTCCNKTLFHNDCGLSWLFFCKDTHVPLACTMCQASWEDDKFLAKVMESKIAEMGNL